MSLRHILQAMMERHNNPYHAPPGTSKGGQFTTAEDAGPGSGEPSTKSKGVRGRGGDPDADRLDDAADIDPIHRDYPPEPDDIAGIHEFDEGGDPVSLAEAERINQMGLADLYHDRLTPLLGRQDRMRSQRAQKAGRYDNPHAIALELKAADQMRDEIKAGKHPAQAFADNFTVTAGNVAIAKKIGLGLSVERGDWKIPAAAVRAVARPKASDYPDYRDEDELSRLRSSDPVERRAALIVYNDRVTRAKRS